MTDAFHTDTIDGVTLEIHHDEPHGNPWEDGDCMPPIWVAGRGALGGAGCALSYATKQQQAAVFPALCEAYGFDLSEMGGAIMESAQANGRATLPSPWDFSCILQECLWESLIDLGKINQYDKTRLEQEAAAFRALGIPAHVFTRRGYSQGDEVNVLIFHPPAWREKVGSRAYDPASDDRQANGFNDMASDADLYAAWAFGDCYRWRVIHEPTGTECESCGGYLCAYMSATWGEMIDEAEAAARQLAQEIAAKAEPIAA